jgi:hypothetical protein
MFEFSRSFSEIVSPYLYAVMFKYGSRDSDRLKKNFLHLPLGVLSTTWLGNSVVNDASNYDVSEGTLIVQGFGDHAVHLSYMYI